MSAAWRASGWVCWSRSAPTSIWPGLSGRGLLPPWERSSGSADSRFRFGAAGDRRGAAQGRPPRRRRALGTGASGRGRRRPGHLVARSGPCGLRCCVGRTARRPSRRRRCGGRRDRGTARSAARTLGRGARARGHRAHRARRAHPDTGPSGGRDDRQRGSPPRPSAPTQCHGDVRARCLEEGRSVGRPDPARRRRPVRSGRRRHDRRPGRAVRGGRSDRAGAGRARGPSSMRPSTSPSRERSSRSTSVPERRALPGSCRR